MLSHTISTDARVAGLGSPLARLLYTWMIPHCDNLGRMPGEPASVRATVIPREQDVSDGDVHEWLQDMDRLGLVCWYHYDGMRYVQMLGWEKHQKIVGNMARTSHYPAPPKDLHAASIRRSYGV